MIGPVALQSMIGLAVIAANLDWNYLSSAIHQAKRLRASFSFSRDGSSLIGVVVGGNEPFVSFYLRRVVVADYCFEVLEGTVKCDF